MKSIRVWSAALVLFAARAAMPQDANLEKVLAQMDASSAKFQDVQADITADLFTAVVQDHEMQTGKTAFRRVGGSMEMATKIETDNGQPSERDLLYRNGELDFYQPSLKQETIFAAGANRGEFDSLLATGFGASGKDLASAWNVSFQGMEAVNGTQAAKLDLVPKQDNIRNNVSHITIWVDLARDISLKQVMFQPSGDTRTVTYTNIRYNSHPPASLFTLKLASGTQVQRR
ncbi:MAG: outer membrane lipoprotein-sorting protein [Acidobacteriaceae bacterium]|jgi:outer membrane lipoprotein-sorting protein